MARQEGLNIGAYRIISTVWGGGSGGEGGSFFIFIGELPQTFLLTTKAPISVVVLGRRLTFRNCMGGSWNVGCRALACSV